MKTKPTTKPSAKIGRPTIKRTCELCDWTGSTTDARNHKSETHPQLIKCHKCGAQIRRGDIHRHNFTQHSEAQA